MPRNIKGLCRICGYYKDLSFEHVPPRRAFNNQPRVFQTMQYFLQGHSHRKFPKGIGEHSLCGKCNTDTADWYGEAFADWTRQGLEQFSKFGDNGLFSLPYHVKPLNVVKQIMVMAFGDVFGTNS